MASTIEGDSFVCDLAELLERFQIPAGIKTEIELERSIKQMVRDYTKKRLHLDDQELRDVFFTHGDSAEDKDLWTKSKGSQNIHVYGCSNTGDIFIKHPNIGTVYIEIKYSKKRGKAASTLPGDLQRAIGQSFIASLKHSHVICLIVCEADIKTRPHDLGSDLKDRLWNEHRIAIIVRPLDVTEHYTNNDAILIKQDFVQLRKLMNSVEKEYNPDGKNLHFEQLAQGDDYLFDKLLKLSSVGLQTVRKHHDFFIKGRLYSDNMYWYDLCLLISAASGIGNTLTYVPKNSLEGIVKNLVEISEYATATGGDMWKRNHEALGNILIAFYDEALIKMAINQSKLVGLNRVKDFVKDTISSVEEVRKGKM
jgi:hypothetical protein